MPTDRAIRLVAILAGLLLATAWWQPFAGTPPSPSTAGPIAVAPADSSNDATAAPVPTPPSHEPATTSATDSVLTLPDGTTVSARNGVAHPAPMSWSRDVPFAPIVATVAADYTGHGRLEWYRHADGTMTTTVMIDARTAGVQRRKPVTIVAHPLPVLEAPRTPGGVPRVRWLR
jgi:hypothetical protein